MNLNKIMKMIVLLMIVSMVIAGCQKKGDQKPTVIVDQDSGELVSNPALSRSGALVVATDDIDVMFNPLYAVTEEEKWVEDLVFDGLFDEDDQGVLTPSLADVFEMSEEGFELTVSIKEGITFHDGTALSIEDILFTYQTVMDDNYKGFYADCISGLSDVQVDEQGRLHFYFSESLLENQMAMTVPILSKNHYAFTLWESFEKSMKYPVGTGPFKFETYTQDESIVFIKYTPHWDDQSKLSGIVLREMSTDEAKLAFSEGKIDLMKMPLSKSAVNEIKDLGFGNVVSQNNNLITFIGMNLNDEVLSQPEVRQALLYTLNREQFIIDEWQGYATHIPLVAASIEEYAMMENDIAPYPYDLEKAKTLLEDNGWILHDEQGIREKNGMQLSMDWLVFSEVDWSYNLANYAQSQWSKLGIKVNIEFIDYESLLERLASENKPDLWNVAWEMTYFNNPDRLFGTETDNYTGYQSEDAQVYFNIIDQSQSKFDKDAAYEQWHLRQQQDIPYIPIARLKSVWAYNSRVKNLSFDAFASWTDSAKSIEVEVLQ